MKRVELLSAFFAFAALSFSTAGAADKKVELEAKAKACDSAATIDFQRELDIPFATLETLGVRIEQARKASDSVGLAAAATELAAAEKAAGKTAKVKATELKQEAVELAKLRDTASELIAVQALTGEDLSKQAAEAGKREQIELADAKDGKRTRGIFHELVVDNESEVSVSVYVNGRYVGYVTPYGHAHFHVHTHHETVLDARGPGHSWHTHVHGDHDNFSWRLLD